jgi:hypothetical protein
MEWGPYQRGLPRYVSVRRVGDVAHLGELVSDV